MLEAEGTRSNQQLLPELISWRVRSARMDATCTWELLALISAALDASLSTQTKTGLSTSHWCQRTKAARTAMSSTWQIGLAECASNSCMTEGAIDAMK